MAGLIVILLCACKLAFLASSTCVKIKEFLFKNEARKAYLHVHKRIIIMLAIYERGLCYGNRDKLRLYKLHGPDTDLTFHLGVNSAQSVTFFTTVNHLSGPQEKRSHLLVVIGRFSSIMFVSVFQSCRLSRLLLRLMEAKNAIGF